jgi:hypothetical protein
VGFMSEESRLLLPPFPGMAPYLADERLRTGGLRE